MPVTVVVRSASPTGRKEDDAPSLTFDGPRVVIGRGAGSDVRLPDPSISTRHATIRSHGTEYAIVDEGSMNGTWVGGVRLLPQTPRVVKNGDLVRVGRVWLEVGVGQRAATPDLGMATRDLALALVKRAMDAVGDDTVARVRIVEGPDIGEEIRLVDEGRAYVLGRGEKCDLPLADPDASREHAAITRRGGQVLLRDMSSRNGVFLGEQRLQPERDTPWRSATMARIGASVIALEEPVSAVLAELESAADEAMKEEDAPPAPNAVPDPPPQETPTAPPPPQPVLSAPIAELVTSAQPVVRPKKRAWTMTDIFVVLFAIAVIGASLAGLVWVLR